MSNASVSQPLTLSDTLCQRARLSRDRRFDGKFYVAVVTTGIYCRPICPAKAANEANVRYFLHAANAAAAGFRPCLRCCPDAAPASLRWLGSAKHLHQASQLCLQVSPVTGAFYRMEEIAEQLGVTSHYIRQLSQQYLGMGLTQFRLHQQLLMAKQLLHRSDLTFEQVAVYSGFNSMRSFNDACKTKLGKTPSDIRRALNKHISNPNNCSNLVQFHVGYRPPYDWQHAISFLAKRCISGMARSDGINRYTTTIDNNHIKGLVEITHQGEQCRFALKFWPHPDCDHLPVLALHQWARHFLDADADSHVIDEHLRQLLGHSAKPGLRLVQTVTPFEALCRAVLGQQVTLSFGVKLINLLVAKFAEPWQVNGESYCFFPTPTAIAASDLSFLPIPKARQQSLQALAQLWVDCPAPQAADWLQVKGIGPWTCDYGAMRGLGDTDRFLVGDAVIKKYLAALINRGKMSVNGDSLHIGSFNIDHAAVEEDSTLLAANNDAAMAMHKIDIHQVNASITPAELSALWQQQIRPWGSYLTHQIWALAAGNVA
ncbi:helix-turn-helix domain-containing protein [Shewanella sp. SNU WT4]|uniref:DNA-3-methyladenine glycosylase 2 n=1 Tax=Shewanella sp. SNU WT4 TaxID=2590015 RepID=UPI00112AE52C|nr:Ada metal-binding domain-containing protein [Shewanella sp. SNU WT4]QDF67571.1 helix-turn-helix domain-containing protein [Shewanella sp. SNU WT4]